MDHGRDLDLQFHILQLMDRVGGIDVFITAG
jgi:hypothetical protein